MGGHVFICYAREDAAFVLTLAAHLKRRGVTLWLDQWDIPAGANWNRSIDDAIYECAAFLIALSPEAVGSGEVEGELLTALAERKPIVPVLCRPCRRIPRQLRLLNYVDFTTCGPDDPEAVEKLVAVLQKPGRTARASSRVRAWLQELRKDEEPPRQLSQEDSENVATPKSYWSLPYGEPEWVTVPSGEFWMGDDRGEEDEQPAHRLFVAEFHIARTPVTNAQYALYVQASGIAPPLHWEGEQPPPDIQTHPVVSVSWEDACRYCQWLSAVTGKSIRLPTEAEWEKAARGNADKRSYPWGEDFEAARCNCLELGKGGTSSVGLFPAGASPYGCLDMAGNVWEWVEDWYDVSFYQEGASRNLKGPSSGEYKVMRGGSWMNDLSIVRLTNRSRYTPDLRNDCVGFRCAW